MACVSAWRTRTSSKGLRLLLSVTIRLVTHGPSRTTALSFSLVDDPVTLGRRDAAELDVELTADDAGRKRRAFDEERLEAVEIRVVRLEVAVEALALPALAFHMAPRTLKAPVPMHVRLGVASGSPSAWQRCRCSSTARRSHRAAGVRCRQPEDNGVGIGRLDGGDVLIESVSGGQRHLPVD